MSTPSPGAGAPNFPPRCSTERGSSGQHRRCFKQGGDNDWPSVPAVSEIERVAESSELGHEISDATTAVKAAMDRLGPADREILRLVEWERLTAAELAVALGVRPRTARVRLHRARRALAHDPAIRALIDPEGDRPQGALDPASTQGAGAPGA